uniref:Phospholipid scramblase n=1 Tax=Lygus hesperus TaxID=30085 RepID=A0A0A9WQX4_LYGHE
MTTHLTPREWMTKPMEPVSCPRGLEFLLNLDHLLVHQQKEPLEVWTGFETNNKYAVCNRNGERVYFAEENSDGCDRCCYGSERPINITAVDMYGNPVIHFYREMTCSSCFFNVQVMNVYSPPGCLIGSVEQDFTFLYPKYNLKNAAGDSMLLIRGPLVTTGFFSNVDFQVFGSDGQTEIGKISKQWGGLLREMFTDADIFGVSFPGDLDVSMKAVVLAACFLIDFTEVQEVLERLNLQR